RLPNAADTTSHQIPQPVFNRIADGGTYLSRHFGTEALRAAVPGYTGGARIPDLAARFRLVPAQSDTLTQTFLTRFATRSALSEGVAYRIQLPNQNSVQARPRSEE